MDTERYRLPELEQFGLSGVRAQLLLPNFRGIFTAQRSPDSQGMRNSRSVAAGEIHESHHCGRRLRSIDVPAKGT